MKAIYCAGEQGRVALDVLRRSNQESNFVFIDDNEDLWGEKIRGVDVLGGEEKLNELDSRQVEFIVAFADNRTTRLEIGEQIRDNGFNIFSAIDPDSTVSPSATIGEGAIINAQSYIGPDVILDDLVIIDSAASISHDVQLSEGVTIGPNATIAGGSEVGRGTFVGAGATILDDVTIGENVFVGAGAVVTSNVSSETTVVGVPANPISY